MIASEIVYFSTPANTHTQWGGDGRTKLGLEMLAAGAVGRAHITAPFSLLLCMLEIFHNKQ